LFFFERSRAVPIAFAKKKPSGGVKEMKELQGVETTILKVIELGKKQSLLRLEENPFRIAGGGQPGDSGILEGENFRARVLDCRSHEAGIVVEAALEKGVPQEGLPVRALPDLEMRRCYSRMHSGEHILSRVLESRLEGLHVYKVAIGEEIASVSFTYEKEISWDLLLEAEEEARKIISRDLPVVIRDLSREEAMALPSLKANWERIQDDSIRVVEIPDFDCIACSGSHVASTGEVGDLLITGYNGSPPEWSLKFSLQGSRIEREYGRILRRVLRHLGCAPEKLEHVITKMQEEKEELSHTLGKARNYLSLPWESEPLEGDRKLHWICLGGLPRDMVSPEVKRRITDYPRDLVLALLPGEGEMSDLLLARGDDFSADCRELLRNPALAARGGGSPEWVSGVTRKGNPEVWKKTLRQSLIASSGEISE